MIIVAESATGLTLTDDAAGIAAAGTVIEYDQIAADRRGVAVTGIGVTGMLLRFNVISGSHGNRSRRPGRRADHRQ